MSWRFIHIQNEEMSWTLSCSAARGRSFDVQEIPDVVMWTTHTITVAEARAVQSIAWITFDYELRLCVLTAAHLKAGDGDLPPITEPALLMRCAWESQAINHTALRWAE